MLVSCFVASLLVVCTRYPCLFKLLTFLSVKDTYTLNWQWTKQALLYNFYFISSLLNLFSALRIIGFSCWFIRQSFKILIRLSSWDSQSSRWPNSVRDNTVLGTFIWLQPAYFVVLMCDLCQRRQNLQCVLVQKESLDLTDKLSSSASLWRNIDKSALHNM